MSSARPRSPPRSWHRCPPSSPSAGPFPPRVAAPSGTPPDGFPRRSAVGCGNRRVVGRHLVQPRSQETAQRQRVRRPPCDATLAVDAFKIPDEQQTDVPPRRQTRPPHSLRVEPGALLFHPFVKAALFQQSVQLFVKRMRYRPRQVCPVRSKSPLVVAASLFGPLPCAQSTAHCCESLNYLRRESRLAPRAASAGNP